MLTSAEISKFQAFIISSLKGETPPKQNGFSKNKFFAEKTQNLPDNKIRMFKFMKSRACDPQVVSKTISLSKGPHKPSGQRSGQ